MDRSRIHGLARAILEVAASKQLSPRSLTVGRAAAALLVYHRLIYLHARKIVSAITKTAVRKFAATQLNAWLAHPKRDVITGLTIPKGETPHHFFFAKTRLKHDRLSLAAHAVISSITKHPATHIIRERRLLRWFSRALHHHAVRVSRLGRFRLAPNLPLRMI